MIIDPIFHDANNKIQIANNVINLVKSKTTIAFDIVRQQMVNYIESLSALANAILASNVELSRDDEANLICLNYSQKIIDYNLNHLTKVTHDGIGHFKNFTNVLWIFQHDINDNFIHEIFVKYANNKAFVDQIEQLTYKYNIIVNELQILAQADSILFN